MNRYLLKAGTFYGFTAGIIVGLLETRRSFLTNSLSNRTLLEIGWENLLAPIILNAVLFTAIGIFLAVLICIYRRIVRPRESAVKSRLLPLILFVPSLLYSAFLLVLITRQADQSSFFSLIINLLLLTALFGGAALFLNRWTETKTGHAVVKRREKSRILPVLYIGAAAFFLFRLFQGPGMFDGRKSCRGSTDQGTSATAPRPNVLLVTIDTLRRDYLGCYDPEGAITPRIDAISESGIRFDRVSTAVPLTIPSHATILTGNYPGTHGVRTNLQWNVLDSASVTMAEILQNHGYATAGFIGAVLINRNSGLAEGFDDYGDIFDHMWYQLLKSGTYLVSRVLFKVGLIEREHYQVRDASEVTDHALEWLREHRDRPFFLWIHYYDPHTPYRPPPEFLEAYLGESWKEEDPSLPVNENRDYYKAEISYTDDQIGRVFDALSKREEMDNTLIVITSDHGESLGEHDYFGHGFKLYEQMIRIPLIMSLPGRIQRGVALEQPVSSIDIAPTVLDILGIEAGGEFDGYSLFPAIREEGEMQENPIYFETLAMYEKNEMKYGVKSLNWKLIYTLPDSDVELYNLDDDPLELTNLADSNEAVVDTLLTALRVYIESGNQLERARDLGRESEMREGLRALGYIQ